MQPKCSAFQHQMELHRATSKTKWLHLSWRPRCPVAWHWGLAVGTASAAGAHLYGRRRNTQVHTLVIWFNEPTEMFGERQVNLACVPLGMASIDSSAPETTSDSSPTLSRRPLRGGWAATSWGRGQDSDSISSSSSDSLGSSSSSGSRRAGGGARAKSTDTSRYPQLGSVG